MAGASEPLILVTGPTGKVGSVFIARLLAEPAFAHWRVRALCHQRELPPHPRVESVHGAIQDRAAVQAALEGVTHVLHLATSKETPDDAMDVSVKGLFWLLEGCRASPAFRQFILIAATRPSGTSSTRTPCPWSRLSPTAPTRAAMRCRRCSRRRCSSSISSSTT